MKNVEGSVETALVEVINKALSGVDFAVEQAPLVIQELITYKSIEHGGGFILFSALSALLSKVAIWALNEKSKLGYSDGDRYSLIAIVSFVMSAILFMASVSDLFSFIKVMTAPKVYLIEYAAKLVG